MRGSRLDICNCARLGEAALSRVLDPVPETLAQHFILTAYMLFALPRTR